MKIFVALFGCIVVSNCQIGVQNCTSPNEFYDCGGACQNLCEKPRAECHIVNIRCNDLCYCLPGFAKQGGKCIPEWQCKNNPGNCYGPNEIYRVDGSACQTTCARLGLPCPIQNIVPNKGCYCNEGYARDKYGNCIPQADCPKGRCYSNDLHEVYSCQKCDETCQTIGAQCYADANECTNGCYCETGYVRGPNGDCVQEYECFL